MARLITLTDDGPFGKAGEQVWVDDDAVTQTIAHAAPAAKKTTASKTASKKK